MPTPATANTGQAISRNRTHGGQGQQAPRLPVLPAEDGTLPHRAIPRVDDPPPRRGVSTASSLVSTISETAPNGRANGRLSGRPSSRRPASSPAPPGAVTVPTPRSCSPTSGAARRCSISLRQQTSVGRQAHRWQTRKMMRLVRPQVGSARTGGAGLGEDGGGGQAGGGVLRGISSFFYNISNSLYFFCYHYTGCAWRLGGARKPHHNGDLRMNRSGGETGLFVYCHDLYIGRMQ